MSTREIAAELLSAALEGGVLRLRAPDAPVDPRADARAIAAAYRSLLKALRKDEPEVDDEDAVRRSKAARGAAKVRARKR
jgi:hypothetical protein